MAQYDVSLALNIKSELKNKVKICFIATVPYAVHSFLRAHINFLSRGYDVTVICNKENIKILRGINAKFIFLDIKREPSVLKDKSKADEAKKTAS
jgi:hypothetical protein